MWNISELKIIFSVSWNCPFAYAFVLLCENSDIIRYYTGIVHNLGTGKNLFFHVLNLCFISIFLCSIL